MSKHVIKPGTYETLYGAPNSRTHKADYKKWLRQTAKPPTPVEYHEDDCPGCLEDEVVQ